MDRVPKENRENVILALLFLATFAFVPMVHYLGSSHLLGASWRDYVFAPTTPSTMHGTTRSNVCCSGCYVFSFRPRSGSRFPSSSLDPQWFSSAVSYFALLPLAKWFRAFSLSL